MGSSCCTKCSKPITYDSRGYCAVCLIEMAAPDVLESLLWLVNLHYGVSMNGSGDITEGEWKDALKKAEQALLKAATGTA